jgi:cell division protein FtsB
VSALTSSYSDPPPNGIWITLNRLLAVLIAVTVLTIVLYRYMPDLGQSRQQLAKIEALKEDIDQQRQLLARRLREEALLKRDPEYISLIARDKLDLMKEGETIYRVEPPKPDPAKMRLNH